MKTSMTTLDIMALMNEVSEILLDSRVNNVYHFGDSVVLRLRTGDGEKMNLRFDLGRWLRISRYYFEPPRNISPWCRRLRKILSGLRVDNAAQRGFDRIVVLELKGKRRYTLYLEWVAGGNIIVVDPDGVIVDVYRRRRTKARALSPGEVYAPPKARFEDPRRLRPQDLAEIFAKSKGNLAQTISRFLGLSGEDAEEICARSGLDRHASPGTLGLDEIGRILAEVRGLIGESESLADPNIVTKDGEPVSVLPTTYAIFRGYGVKRYGSFNDAVDDYAEMVEAAEREARLREELERERQRLKKSIEEVEKMISSNMEEAERLYSAAKTLMADLWRWGPIWRELRRIAEEEPGGLAGRRYGNALIVDYDPSRRVVVMEVGGVRLPMPLDLSFSKGVESIFNRAKELKRKAERGRVHLEELRRRVEELKAPPLRRAEPIRVPRKKWFENYHWFVSSDGYLVVGGRDSSQNEALIKKHLGAGDVVMHADIHGSPFTLIKNVGPSPPEKTVFEAAQLTVSYSKAWEMGFSAMDAYWVLPDQVSKEAPSGTYLGKGAFMIYGKRNYVKGVPLRIAVGLDDRSRVVAGPVEPVARMALRYVELAPGGDREKAIGMIHRCVLGGIENPSLAKILRAEVASRLPRGGLRVVRCIGDKS